MRTGIERRHVAWDATTGTLTVGERATHVTCAPGDNECLLRTYLSLVAEQREVALQRSFSLRRDDIAVLAELLDLDDVDLEDRLRRLLRLSEADAADLTRRLRRQRMAAAAMGVGLLAGIPGVNALADASEPADPPPVTSTTTSPTEAPDSLDQPIVVEFDLPEGPTTVPPPVAPTTTAPAPAPVAQAPEPAPAPAPEPVPATEPEVDIGYSVRYERDPNFVPPEGVDIGDAMVVERDAPPAG